MIDNSSTESGDSPGDGRSAIPAITPDSLTEFWRTHDQRWSRLDDLQDLAGLANVCHAGAPEWVNRYAAACQDRVFARLLVSIPLGGDNRRGLDIGCGAGRWSRKLAGAGFSVVGVDLQPDLLERNRRLMPGIRFVYSSVQDFRDEPFDLVNSVTVIQHNPPAEQTSIVRRLRELVRSGGHALIMENTVDVLPHVFARSEDGWRELFESNGFRAVRSIPYDFRLAQRLGRKLAGSRTSGPSSTTSAAAPRARPRTLKRALVEIDRSLEGLLVGLALKRSTHCGFLFVAV